MSVEKIINENMAFLKENEYPGRGIVTGMTPDSKNLVQVYWIMGRSENSRNRIFVKEDNGFVKTDLFNKSKSADTSLIIYYPMREINGTYIVSNGDQTDTIFESIKKGGSFEDAINTREFEPDGPNFTPRISGVVYKKSGWAHKLSIIKSFYNDPKICQRHFFNYESFFAGVGHCVTTYEGNGSPLPSFSGEPRIVKIPDSIEETLNLYWETLNKDNKISLAVKFIDVSSGASKMMIKNKHV